MLDFLKNVGKILVGILVIISILLIFFGSVNVVNDGTRAELLGAGLAILLFMGFFISKKQ